MTPCADGNRRLYLADPARLAEVKAMLDAFWGARLARLAHELNDSPPAHELNDSPPAHELNDSPPRR